MLACPKCGYKMIYTKQRVNHRYCLTCGYEGDTKEFEFNKSNPPKPSITLKCPKCNSNSVYTLKKTRQRVCRRCGYKGKKEEFKK